MAKNFNVKDLTSLKDAITIVSNDTATLDEIVAARKLLESHVNKLGNLLNTCKEKESRLYKDELSTFSPQLQLDFSDGTAEVVEQVEEDIESFTIDMKGLKKSLGLATEKVDDFFKLIPYGSEKEIIKAFQAGTLDAKYAAFVKKHVVHQQRIEVTKK